MDFNSLIHAVRQINYAHTPPCRLCLLIRTPVKACQHCSNMTRVAGEALKLEECSEKLVHAN